MSFLSIHNHFFASGLFGRVFFGLLTSFGFVRFGWGVPNFGGFIYAAIADIVVSLTVFTITYAFEREFQSYERAARKTFEHYHNMFVRKYKRRVQQGQMIYYFEPGDTYWMPMTRRDLWRFFIFMVDPGILATDEIIDSIPDEVGLWPYPQKFGEPPRGTGSCQREQTGPPADS